MNVRRNLTGTGRRDASIVAPLVHLAIDLDRRGRADTDTVGRIENTPVTVGMLKVIYELYAGVPFGQWPVPASSGVIDHWGNEWRIPVLHPARADVVRPAGRESPMLTDIVTPSSQAHASNDAIVDHTESLTVVQRMRADSAAARSWRRPLAPGERRGPG
jgi:hypothetical protein